MGEGQTRHARRMAPRRGSPPRRCRWRRAVKSANCQDGAGRAARPVRGFKNLRSTLPFRALAPAFHFLLGLSEIRHAGVAGSGHGEGPVRGAVIDGFGGVIVGEEAVDEAAGETVAAADAVHDLKTGAVRGFMK